MKEKIMRCPIMRRGPSGHWRTLPCNGPLQHQKATGRYVCQRCLCIFGLDIIEWLLPRIKAVAA